MYKKIIILLLIIVICMTGCTNKQPDEGNDNPSNNITQTENIDSNGDMIMAVSLDETEEKITETFTHESLGKITFIHSTTSSIESLNNGEIARGDVLIIGDFQYTFMKQYDGEKYVDWEHNGFTVKAIKEKETYEDMYDVLFNAQVISADYCFYNNKLLKTPPHLSSKVSSTNHCFDGCTNLVFDDIAMYLHTLTYLNTTQYMFANCDAITNADMYQGEIQDTTGMFFNCKNLTQFTTISDDVQTANNMFEGCINLTGEIFIGSNIKSYNDIFKDTVKNITLIGENSSIIAEKYTNVKGE